MILSFSNAFPSNRSSMIGIVDKKSDTNATLVDYLQPLDRRGACFYFAELHVDFSTRFAAHFLLSFLFDCRAISFSFLSLARSPLREARSSSRSRSRDRYPLEDGASIDSFGRPLRGRNDG